MSKEKQQVTDWALDVSDAELSKANPNNFGGEFRRVHYGDPYTLEIADAQQEAKEGAKPHVMLVLTWKVVAAGFDAGKDYIGDSIVARYAGSPQSPKLMQDSRARLFAALKLGPGQHKRSALIGKRVDAAIVWNLAAPYTNQETGKISRSVFANVTGERPVGGQCPPTLDPEKMSAKAAAWIEENYGEESDTGGSSDTPAWEQPATAVGSEADAGDAGDTAPSWRPESEITDPGVFTYRALIKLGHEHADAAREGLTQLGFDPDGPVDVAQLSGEIAEQYKAKFAPAKPAGLPGLPSLGASNGAAAGGTAAAPARRTGTRSKSA
jgi:hypothetical protein